MLPPPTVPRLPLVVACLLLGPGGPCRAGDGPRASAEEVEFFERKVRPVLAGRCYECHSARAGKSRGGLLLDSREGLLRGGDSGPAVVPGDPERSPLIRAVRRTDPKLQMPPKEALPAGQVADLVAWVKAGAPDPRTGPAAAPGVAGRLWSLRPVQAPPVPAVRDRAWPHNAVDHFLLARLEAKGLAPVADTDRRTLIRRATFDLIGLPPTPAEAEAFVADDAPDAWEKVVDRLLASPHHGERWGRHWLDVVRYADTAGNAPDFPVPQAHRYRDYVIRSFNEDTPYDRFLTEQLAGDLLPGPPQAPSASAGTVPALALGAWGRPATEKHAGAVATGYLAIHRRFDLLGGGGTDHQEIEDVVETLGRSVLGLGLSCARCHDHKFDPISQKDYYALYGIFSSTRFPFPGCEGKTVPQDVVPGAYAVADGTAKNARVHRGGDPSKLGDEVPRRFLEVLGGQALPPGAKGSGRLELAGWLTDPKNPLTVRVMVNRLWEHHFGKGLVATPNDFGARGASPTHPELLDHLATRFIASGWSVKAMHRVIMLSRAYRLAGTGRPENARDDADNGLLWKFPRRRLDAESVRDALLAVGGALDRTPGGAHPFPPPSQWSGFSQHNPFLAVYETDRRSVYLMQQRIRRHPFLALFDGADPNASTARRGATTTPLQALFLMNDPFVHGVAGRFAEKVYASGRDDRERLRFAYALAYARPPTPAEEEVCADYLRRYAERLAAEGAAVERRAHLAWASLARVLLGSNEFIYVD